MLRVMRVVAPAEWSQGLPFPSPAMMQRLEPVMVEPEEVSLAAWLDSRAEPRFAVANGADFSLPEGIERLAGRIHGHLHALARGISGLADNDSFRRLARHAR